MTLPVTITGRLSPRTAFGQIPSWRSGLWRVHTGGSGDVLHELRGYHSDAVRWIADHGLTYDPMLVNP